MRNRKEFADKLSVENGKLMETCIQILDENVGEFVDKISRKTNKFANNLSYEIFGILGGQINSEVEEKWDIIHQEIIDEVIEKLGDITN